MKEILAQKCRNFELDKKTCQLQNLAELGQKINLSQGQKTLFVWYGTMDPKGNKSMYWTGTTEGDEVFA